MGTPARILLVEDNQVFREALELLLGLRDDVEVVAAIADGSDAVSACDTYRPDVVLMD
jgi:DNA-binding NarL/FixJ family response regulator